MKFFFYLLLSIVLIYSCKDESTSTEPAPIDDMYFPSVSQNIWETMSLADAGFNETNLSELTTFLDEKDTKGFIILKNGKIVIEKYFNGHSQSSNWYWASAAKTLTATVVGIAQDENFLSIDDSTSDYLGSGWTSTTQTQESAIKIRHQLTMTTGLNDGVEDPFCYDSNCLEYLAESGTRWAYHNGPYTLLQQLISEATNQSFRDYFTLKLQDKIGMNGFWLTLGNLEIYYSTTRSMARFGLLALNDFIWNESEIIEDNTFVHDLTNTSQQLNFSYGYLWWLNGKSSYMIPQTQILFNGSLVPNAPIDMFAAMGKNDQRIYVVPSEKIVIIRMGESAYEENLTLSLFDNELWEKINAVINN